MASFRLLAAIQIFIATASCRPAISFPFNSQLPPVARLNQLFSHSFSPYTFESGLGITYTLGSHPSWLSINSDERRLFGIPEDGDVPPGDVVGQEVEIIATDASGSVSMMATVVVCREDGPSIQIPVSEQLSRFGDYSAPSSVLSYPSTDFEYKFDPDTFQHEPDMINYYAVSGDSSPLPSWIKFDAASLAFFGQTPAVEALHQPPQNFDVRLVASDIVGFSASSLEFSIIVGGHKLATDTPHLVLNATRGDKLQYDGLADAVSLDGEPVSPADLNVSASNLPAWLSFDLESWIIEGTPDVSDSSTNFTIRFEDAFSDILRIQALVRISTGLFQATFDDVEVTPGETFSLDLAPHFKDAADIEVTLDTEPDQDWLELDGLRIEGKVPKSASGDLKISIEAASKSSELRETEFLHVIYLAPDGKVTTTPTPTASATPQNEDSDRDDDDDDDSDEDDDNDDESDYYESDEIPTGTILLATIVPVLAAAFGIMLLVCFLRRRRSRRKYFSNKLRSKISKPVVGSLRVNPSDASMQELEREHVALEADMQMFHPSKRGYTQFTPEGSTRISTSSDSMSSAPTRTAGAAYTARHPPHHVPKHSAGHSGTDDDNRSWFTVAQSPTAAPSEASIRSHHSATAVGPISTNHLLPAPLFLSDSGGDTTFRSGLELTIPSLDDLTDLQPMPTSEEGNPQRAYSSITSSSAALPSSRLGSPKDGIEDYPAIPSAAIAMATSATAAAAMKRDAEKSASDKDWSTIRETESGSSVPDILPRGRTPLSSQQWASQVSVGDSYYNTGTYGRSKSFMTEASFASDENWRLVSQRGVGSLDKAQTGLHSLSNRFLFDDSPESPPRPGTFGVGDDLKKSDSEIHGTLPKLSSDEPAGWAPLKPTASKYSRLNKLEPPAMDWRREDSSKFSEGSSFKVFI